MCMHEAATYLPPQGLTWKPLARYSASMSTLALPLDPELLRRLYLTEKQSIQDIATRLDCGRATIYRHLLANGIPIRSKQAAQWLIYERGRREYPRSSTTSAHAWCKAHPRAMARARRKGWLRSAALRSFDAKRTVVCSYCGQSFVRRRCDVEAGKARGRRPCCSSSCRARLIPRRRPG